MNQTAATQASAHADTDQTLRLAGLLGCAPQGLPPLSALPVAELKQLADAVEKSLLEHDRAMVAARPEILRPLLERLGRRR